MPSSSAENKTKVLYGDHIGREGKLRVGCSAIVPDAAREKVLLTRRSDNGLFCLPGGMIDPGESASEACEREMLEETGLRVRVVKLVGVYSDPNKLTVYPDGNKAHVIVLCFEVEPVGGTLGLSGETTEAAFVPVGEAVQMDLFHGHTGHIRDWMENEDRAFVR
ncbi:MAG TPA: NUDIX domain-containing protein [Anaerolineales bacterium]|nr:NUDIX domain-containing protein [Anaerolineales bacterium]